MPSAPKNQILVIAVTVFSIEPPGATLKDIVIRISSAFPAPCLTLPESRTLAKPPSDT